jgi:hypothetical protein
MFTSSAPGTAAAAFSAWSSSSTLPPPPGATTTWSLTRLHQQSFTGGAGSSPPLYKTRGSEEIIFSCLDIFDVFYELSVCPPLKSTSTYGLDVKNGRVGLDFSGVLDIGAKSGSIHTLTIMACSKILQQITHATNILPLEPIPTVSWPQS